MTEIERQINEATGQRMRAANGDDEVPKAHVPMETRFHNSLPGLFEDLAVFIREHNNGTVAAGVFEERNRRFDDLLKQTKMAHTNGANLIPFFEKIKTEAIATRATLRRIAAAASSLESRATSLESNISTVLSLTKATPV